MRAKDRARIRVFTREEWVELWNRIPENGRRNILSFIFHELYALETGGAFGVQWHYETSEHREETDGPIFDEDQPGDSITFKGHLSIGLD